MNSFYHIEADLSSNISQACHMLVLTRMVDGKIANVEGWQIENAINQATSALAWPGILDDQRGKAHFRRGVAFMDKAKYLLDCSGKISKEEKTLAKWPNATRCYEEAAQDFYYAMHVEFKGKDMAMLRTFYDQCRRKCDMTKEPDLFRNELPGVGPWKGDPRLLDAWNEMEFMLTFLLRQRLGNEEMSKDEIKALYARCGLAWTHRPDGTLDIFPLI